MFLERRSYRMRRVLDAARLWPVLGLCLWMVPLLWPQPGTSDAAVDPMPMSAALSYLFGVWALLILGSWLLWRWIGRGETSGDTDPR